MPDFHDGQSERSVSMRRKTAEERQEQALEEFRVAVRRALTLGYDAELLAEEVGTIWVVEFEGDDA